MTLLAHSAFAHSPLTASQPANGAVISKAPTSLVLTFQGKIRLTRVTVSHADQPANDLEITGESGFAAEHVLQMKPMGPGLYVIEWRGLGDDGHAQSGTFNFRVFK
jgi:methionine-rich copper-binding protein CopC